MPRPPVNTREFQALVEVVEALRGPQGCPWDKEQTNKTLTQYAIEEAHELAEAIDKDDKAGTVEELGDLLLQVILHAEIGRQNKEFTLEDVIQGITEKMIRRHPHVFGETKVTGSAEVLENWSKIKEAEKVKSKSPFASIPLNLPALIRAQKIGNKTVRLNFDWENSGQVVEKIEEEIGELKEALESKSLDEQQKELGDVLFSVVQLARHLNFDAEQALRQTNKKFEKRFMIMRELTEKDDKIFANMQTRELEHYWQKAKEALKNEAHEEGE